MVTRFSRGNRVTLRDDRADAYGLPRGAVYTVLRTYPHKRYKRTWVVIDAPKNPDGTDAVVDSRELRAAVRPSPLRHVPDTEGWDRNPGLYGEWALRQDVTYPHWVRAFMSQDGSRRYVYEVKLVGAYRTGASRYDVSYRRADGDFDIRYRAAGGTGGYVGQAKTRDGAFRMAARNAKQAGLVPIKSNPRKGRSVKRKKIRQSMRVVARGVEMDIARAFGRLPISTRHGIKRGKRFRKNPMSRKDFELMAALIAQAHINKASEGALIALTDFAVEMGKATNPRFDADRFVRRIVQLVGEGKPFRYVNKNPKRNPLAIYGAVNPPRRSNGVTRGARTVKELGRVVEIRYRRHDDKGFYYHRFKTRPRLLALSDGTLAVR